MKIWIVRKHPCLFGHYLSAFCIVSAHATKREAMAEAKARNKGGAAHGRRLLHTVGCVQLKEQQP